MRGGRDRPCRGFLLRLRVDPGPGLGGDLEDGFRGEVLFPYRLQHLSRSGGCRIGGPDVTWIITAKSENEVEIEQRFAYSNRTLIPNSGYTPDVSPNWFTGVISSSSLTVIERGGLFSDDRVVGEFDFTTDNIAGTWDDLWELAYAQEVYTDVKDLILVRQ